LRSVRRQRLTQTSAASCCGLAAPFVGPMTGYLWDDGLRHGILEALCRMNETAPELVDGVRDRLLAINDTDNPGERACLDSLLAVDRESADGE